MKTNNSQIRLYIDNAGKLEENSVSANFAHTKNDAISYQTNFYKFDGDNSYGKSTKETTIRKFRIVQLQENNDFETGES